MSGFFYFPDLSVLDQQIMLRNHNGLSISRKKKNIDDFLKA